MTMQRTLKLYKLPEVGSFSHSQIKFFDHSHRSVHFSFLSQQTKTEGFRRMVAADVPKAFRLLEKVGALRLLDI